MAEENDTGQKTEAPTGRRINQARSEGMIARSVELSQVLSMSTAFLLLHALGPRIWNKLQVLFEWGLTSTYGTKPMLLGDLKYHFYGILLFLLPEILLLLVLVAFVGSMSTLIQTNFNWSSKLLNPKFSHLNPLNGLKRIFSLQNSFQLGKAIAKFAIIAPIAYFSFFGIFPEMLSLMDLPISMLLPYTGQAAGKIFWPIMKLMAVLAIVDYAWSYYRTNKQLKMTKVEVKDERKATEGDETTKLKIKARALQRARQRMLQAVKNADVVVTNPTHYAVALQYTMQKGVAPQVIAKGKDHLALRIREIAKEAGVPVIERKTLARALYSSVEIGNEIPYDLYAAVAELLAYVFRLKGKNPFRKQQQADQRR